MPDFETSSLVTLFFAAGFALLSGGLVVELITGKIPSRRNWKALTTRGEQPVLFWTSVSVQLLFIIVYVVQVWRVTRRK